MGATTKSAVPIGSDASSGIPNAHRINPRQLNGMSNDTDLRLGRHV
jgi:hypothetical protein